MKDDAKAELLRRDLDAILKKWRKIPPAVPPRGWVHNLRTALGMTAQDLGRRMKMSQAGVAALEISEAKDAVQLATLRRAAKALDCDLVYALVPKKSLEKTLENQRRKIARGDLGKVMPMTVLVQPEYQDMIAAYAQTIKRNRLWRE